MVFSQPLVNQFSSFLNPMISQLNCEVIALKMERIGLVEAEKNTIDPGICVQFDTILYGEKSCERSLFTFYFAFSNLARANRSPIL